MQNSTRTPRPYVPVHMREDIIREIHEREHPSIRSTKRLVKAKFFWPSMDKTISAVCNSCAECKKQIPSFISSVSFDTLKPYIPKPTNAPFQLATSTSDTTQATPHPLPTNPNPQLTTLQTPPTHQSIATRQSTPINVRPRQLSDTTSLHNNHPHLAPQTIINHPQPMPPNLRSNPQPVQTTEDHSSQAVDDLSFRQPVKQISQQSNYRCSKHAQSSRHEPDEVSAMRRDEIPMTSSTSTRSGQLVERCM